MLVKCAILECLDWKHCIRQNVCLIKDSIKQKQKQVYLGTAPKLTKETCSFARMHVQKAPLRASPGLKTRATPVEQSKILILMDLLIMILVGR